MSLVDLQKALDELREAIDYIAEPFPAFSRCRKTMRIVQDLFSCFQAEQTAKEQSLRKLLEPLDQNAKTFSAINKHVDSLHTIALAKTRRQLPSEAEAWKLLHKALHEDKWVSVETVTALLQKFVAEKTVAEEKNVEYAKLVAGQAKEYAEKQSGKEQALRKLLEDWPVFPPFASLPDDIPETVLTYCLKTLQLRKCLEKVFDETLSQETDKSFVLVSRKQLSELLETKRKEWKIAYPLKSQEDFNYRVLIDEIFDELVKELLAGSVPLPLCEKCKVTMRVISTRDDGCRYFECPQCGQTMGEETEEWFKQQEGSVKEGSK